MKDINVTAQGRMFAILRHYGLQPYKARRGTKAFRGQLQCERRPVAVQLEITDWDFIRYPRITLLDRPDSLPPLLAHVDAEGNLCYFASGSIILDRYRPDDAVQQCLDAAIRVLDDIMSGKSQTVAIANEFSAYWTFGQSPIAWPVLIDVLPKGAQSALYFSLTEEGKPTRGLITTDVFAARNIAQNIDVAEVSKGSFACLLFESRVMPTVGGKRLPSTIRELFEWLRQWDSGLSKEVQTRLGSDREYLARNGCVIAIATPAGALGVRFLHERKHRLGYSTAPKQYRQYLHASGGTTPITRLRIDDISAEYIHTRNLDESPSLASKRISLIGCGAIGGYLAQALVRLGAGTGENGLLRLFDIGELEPDNLGRHALGFPALYQNKAIVMREELVRQFPYVALEAHPDSPALTDEFFTTDLVIDGTGDEAVSEMINSRHVRSRRGPLLYIWVGGNGEYVQALWSDTERKHGCYRCMRLGDGPNYRQERFPVLENVPKTRFLGCRSFTPYAVSAPLSASALAIDMIIDWLKGDVKPRFRTRYVENVEVRRIKNQDIGQASHCPACSGT